MEEKIPEMELVREIGDFGKLERALFENPSEAFHGKFITIEGPNRENYLFAMQTDLSSHAYLYKEFVRINSDGTWEGQKESSRSYLPTGGGYMVVKDKEISLSGTSTRFGDYDKEIVRAIVERYKTEHLPDYEVELK